MSGQQFIALADELVRAQSAYAVLASPSGPVGALAKEAEKMNLAWSQSSIGPHANVYYEGLLEAPAGYHFDSEWGLSGRGSFSRTRGNWASFTAAEIKAEVARRAGQPNLDPVEKAAQGVRWRLEQIKAEALSMIAIEIAERSDSYLSSLRDQIAEVSPRSVNDFQELMVPKRQFMTRDTIAAAAGLKIAPHQEILAQVASLREVSEVTNQLEKLLRQAGSHLLRLESRGRQQSLVGTNVFIGHGRSAMWRELKDFVGERLHLPYDEFNRVPVAGVTNIARLSEMLGAAAVALIVLTAEDEQADGAMHARQNVIHEAGLFQGKLGFTKAIVLLEEGCAEFSNIQGLGQIRFPTGKISAAFEEVRRVLEREGLIEP
ncbi:MAG TPA: TIR domain-containing protein [Brevundimonas sp.]|jgi:predicted nucleotide-binding protein